MAESDQPIDDHDPATVFPPRSREGSDGKPSGSRKRFAEIIGFEILEELGRGTMGVVYKARDKSLGRLVALKMVVAGGHAAPDQLARFEIEAHAVASLQHPNIVQIHQIGVSEGLPYLSLEYVEGLPLDRTLDAKPQRPRDALRLVETLARAIHFAHQRHIVHRDLKPANVLIARDGTPKITDFGLAKNLEGPSSQTKSGTLIGTPSYMAPEQASGEGGIPGPAVDIHALGAILYEMLVGRPPYLGASPYETTMQVVNQEPVRPSRLVPRLPADIETICLKCLQKDAAKRYPDAARLAEDCRRFLAGAPILSRPVSPPERLWRWCLRNPRVAGLAAAVAGLLLVVAVGSSIAAVMLTNERNAKEAQREAAVDARLAAEAASRLADEQRLAAESARKEADVNARLATEQAGLALSTMQLLVDKVQTQLEDAPRTQTLKRELLETAIEGLKAVAKQGEGSTSIETTMLAAHMRTGNMFRQLGATDDAMKEYEICLDIARRRSLAHPDNDASQGNLAAVLDVLGDMRQELSRDMTAALDSYMQSLRIWKELRAKPPGTQSPIPPMTIAQNLAEATTKVAVTKLRLGDPVEALPLLKEAIGLRRELCEAMPDDESLDQDLARSFSALGEVAFLTGQSDLAATYYEESLTRRQKRLMATPDDLGAKLELANTLGNYGELWLRTGNLAAARRHFDRALELNRELLAIDSDLIEHQFGVAVDLYRQGVLETLAGDSATARTRFDECLAMREKIAARDPRNESRQRELMLAVARSGDHRRAAMLAERIRTGQDDPERLIDLARCYAQCSAAAATDAPASTEAYAERAEATLRDACAAGYRDGVTLLTDPEFNPIRERPGFAALIGAFAAKAAVLESEAR